MNLLSFIKIGNARSVKAKKNILAATLIKGADTLVYLLLVPLTLGYLNSYEYGIWLTLNSLLMWINSFDIGLGSGLRNKLAVAIAENDKGKARSYVSTTLFMLIIIMAMLLVVVSLLINYLDWYELLNVEEEVVENLRDIIQISFVFFCFNFILKFIGNVYQALQLPAVNYLIAFLGHFLSLIIIFILTKTIEGSLFWVAFAYSAAPPLVYLLCYPITFSKLYPYLAPSYRYFRIDYLKDLLSLSVVFFVIQIMGIVLFSLSNIIISNMFGPDQVTPYNIAYRYFSVVSIVFSLLLAPIWSATTDAYAKGDIKWIENCIRKMQKVMGAVLIIIVIMIVSSPLAFKIWVGDEVRIPVVLSLFMGGYMFILLWSLCFSSILNGLGVLRLQAITIMVIAVLFYPVCSFLGTLYGVTGIVISMCVLNLPGAFLNTIQLYKLTHNTAKGIWKK